MKTRAYLLALPAAFLALTSCGDKGGSPTTPEPTEVTEPSGTTETPPVAEPIPAAETAAETVDIAPLVLTAEQRAETLGFARYLPADTEAFVSFHNGADAAKRTQGLKIWEVFESMGGMMMGGMMGPGPGFDEMDFEFEMDEDFAIPEGEEDAEEEPTGRALEGAALGAIIAGDDEDGDFEGMFLEDMDMDMEMEMRESVGPGTMLGTEFGIAMGPNTGIQAANALTAYTRYSYLRTRAMARGLVAAAKTGDKETFSEAMKEFSGAGFGELLSDPESGIAVFERMQMPPLYIHFRLPEEERENAALEIASMVEFLGMAEDMVTPVEFEKAGSTFAGYRLVGSAIAESMEEGRDTMSETLEEETIDQLIAAVAAKDLVVVSGVLGEYVVLFVGASVDDFALVEDLGSSILAGPALAHTDAFHDRPLAAVMHGEAAMIKRMLDASGGMADLANAVRDGISGEEGLGDTRDLEAMLRIAAERELALRQMTTTETFGMVAFFEDGLKVESFGGTDQGALDWETPASLGALGDSPDVFIFANMTSDAAYDAASRAYLEVLVETAYALAMKLSEYPIEGMEEQIAMIGMFDEKLRPEVAAIWTALNSSFAEGLGAEKAFVVDLKGGMPALPGIPQAVVDSGRFIRASMIAPVTDREKLAGSWTEINAAATRLMAVVSELADKDIPMPKPMSAKNDGYTSWFINLPFTDNDFIPSATIGDDWFVASTSTNHAMELIGQANAVPSAEVRNGATFRMNFVAMQEFARETMKVMEEHKAELFGGEDSMPHEQFEEQKEMIGSLIDALDDLDSLSTHTRRENGVLRSTLHFKTR
jgi:hypothetical protein